MARYISLKVAALALAVSGGPALAVDKAQVAPRGVADWLQRLSQERIVPAYCCKVCRKGKACGDSCISRAYNCRKPPGCACDG
ncbi:hypothetical protein [Rhodovulum euryhalinum]|uniref:Uncharacterized protein n=1 Tax=Rhodovulum euryhalinum TaxID=35805 RepID=A0A4V2S9Z5_9RHOB|nr:hypothetical protein [Rhodovulum euryhalinum]TCO69750.1 hypothetical protein EV655_11335 [Rhodovulum euryhalinum]